MPQAQGRCAGRACRKSMPAQVLGVQWCARWSAVGVPSLPGKVSHEAFRGKHRGPCAAWLLPPLRNGWDV